VALPLLLLLAAVALAVELEGEAADFRAEGGGPQKLLVVGQTDVGEVIFKGGLADAAEAVALRGFGYKLHSTQLTSSSRS